MALSADAAVTRFELVDADGRVAVSYRGSERGFRIETARLAEGLYQVRLDARGQVLRAAIPFQVSLQQPSGELAQLTTAQKAGPIDTVPGYDKVTARTVEEEVVTQIGGEIVLPAGRHEVLLVHRNIVDGQLEKNRLGSITFENA